MSPASLLPRWLCILLALSVVSASCPPQPDCSEAQSYCLAESGGSFQFGCGSGSTYTCGACGSGQIFQPTPSPALCPGSFTPDADVNMCAQLTELCENAGSTLRQADVTLNGGTFQCQGCDPATASAAESSSSDVSEESSAAKDAPTVLKFVGLFFGISVLFFLIGFAMDRWLLAPKPESKFNPKMLSRPWFAAKTGALDDDGEMQGFWYYCKNSHELLQVFCGDRNDASMLDVVRGIINGLITSFALALVFAGLDAAALSTTVANDCYFFQDSGTTIITSGSSTSDGGSDSAELTMDLWTTATVLVLNQILGFGLGKFASELQRVQSKGLKFFLSLLNEAAAIGVLVFCIFIEKSETSDVEVEGKYVIYAFTTIASKAGDWGLVSTAQMVAKWFLAGALMKGAEALNKIKQKNKDLEMGSMGVSGDSSDPSSSASPSPVPASRGIEMAVEVQTNALSGAQAEPEIQSKEEEINQTETKKKKKKKTKKKEHTNQASNQPAPIAQPINQPMISAMMAQPIMAAQPMRMAAQPMMAQPIMAAQPLNAYPNAAPMARML